LAEKNRGRPEAATEWFVRAVELEPESSVVHFYLGEIYYNRGLNAEALGALERAVALNPDNANAHYLMAFVLGDMGRHQDARAASKRAVALNPPLARAQTNLSLERYNAERKSQQVRLREAPQPEVAEGSEGAHRGRPHLLSPGGGSGLQVRPRLEQQRRRARPPDGHRRGDRRVPDRVAAARRIRRGAAQSGAAAVPPPPLPARARSLPPGAR